MLKGQKRRDFLKTVGLGFAAVLLEGCTTRTGLSSEARRPNILFIMSDDLKGAKRWAKNVFGFPQW